MKKTNWHSTAAGHAWHVQHGHNIAANIKEKEFICEECGEHFFRKPYGLNRFCSAKCKSKWRRKSGIDDIVRICDHCGKLYKVNKYKEQYYCSKSCALKARL